MADAYLKFVMSDPGLASSLVAGEAADRAEQNKRRLRDAATVMKRRMMEEVNKSVELDRIQRADALIGTTGRESLAEQLAASNEAANAQNTDAAFRDRVAANQVDADLGTGAARGRILSSNQDYDVQSIPGSGAVIQDVAERVANAAPGAKSAFLRTNVEPSQKNEITPEEFDSRIGGLYRDTGAGREFDNAAIVEQNKDAVVDPRTGTAYASRAAGVAANRRENMEIAKVKAVEGRANDAARIETEHTIKMNELQALKGQARDALKRVGIEDKDITPEMLDSATAKFNQAIAEETASYNAAVKAATKKGKISKADAPKLKDMKKSLDDLISMGKRVSGAGETFKQAKSTFQRSVGDDAKAFLEQELVNNPFPDTPDPRVESDRSREKELEARLPEILQLQGVDPDGAKVFLDQLNRESKQGDAGLEAMRKTAEAFQKGSFGLLGNSIRGNKDFLYQQELLKQNQQKIDLAKEKENNANSARDKKLANDEWKALNEHQDRLLAQSVALLRQEMGDEAKVFGQYVTSGTYTKEGQKALEQYDAKHIDAATRANVNAAFSLAGLQGGSAYSRALRTVTKPAEGWGGKPTTENVKAPAPLPLPPIDEGTLSPAEKRARKKGLRTPHPPATKAPKDPVAVARFRAMKSKGYKETVNPDGTVTFTTPNGNTATYMNEK